MRNIDVRRAFFTEEPKTLFEVREVALLKEVISDVVLVYPLGVMSPDPSSKGSRDVGTQTGTNGGYLSKSKGYNNQRWFDNYQKKTNSLNYQRPIPSQQPPLVGNTVGPSISFLRLFLFKINKFMHKPTI